MNISKDIQTPYGKALGDCWSVINYFINLGLEKNEIIKLALWYPKGNSIKRVDKLKEILPLFENDNIIELVDLKPTVPKINWTCGYTYTSIPTKIKWKPNLNKKICYQFDGKSKKDKNFPSKEIELEVINSISAMGYELIKLGCEKSLKECVNIASDCELFLGIDSGMCYLAASVGIPIFFCKNKRPIEIWNKTNHSNKHFILSENYVKLIEQVHNYNKNGINYYVNNAQNINIFKKYMDIKLSTTQ